MAKQMNNIVEWSDITPMRNSGKMKIKCPACTPHLRKPENKNNKDMAVDYDEGKAFCHNCGAVSFKESNNMKQYDLPTKTNVTKVSQKVVDYFFERGISQQVIVDNKIAMQGNDIMFPYIQGGKLVNYKTRGVENKTFRQAKNAKPIMYNYDRCIGSKTIIITEGEIDAMSFNEVGLTFTTSPNQGAPNVNDKNVDAKLECLTNCFEMFEQAEVVYIAVDNDPNGKRLEKELIRRVGIEKCKIIDFSPYKDANEVLVRLGRQELLKRYENASDAKMEGTYTIKDFKAEIFNQYENGLNKGETTHIPELDEIWKWRVGEVNLWTGYQNEGKSTFLKFISVVKAVMDGDKFAFFDPESIPIVDFYNDLIEMYVGKTMDIDKPNYRMSEDELNGAIDFIDSKFHFIYPEENLQLESIFLRFRFLVQKFGVKHVVFDPYNTIEHLQKTNEREDLYISRFMSQLKKFAVENQVSVHLVAHQNTPRINKETGDYYKVDGNNVKGGGTFADKCDNLISVQIPYRITDRNLPNVDIKSHKIKKQKLVAKPGELTCYFDWRSTRYNFGSIQTNPLMNSEHITKKEKASESFSKPLDVFMDNDVFNSYNDVGYDNIEECPF